MEKVQIATQLEALGVDIIEAGFPISSVGDFDATKAVAQAIYKSTVAGLARTTREDITRCWEAVQHAERPRIHTFIATSAIHMEKKLKSLRSGSIALPGIQQVGYFLLVP